jgi:hypothetical protein
MPSPVHKFYPMCNIRSGLECAQCDVRIAALSPLPPHPRQCGDPPRVFGWLPLLAVASDWQIVDPVERLVLWKRRTALWSSSPLIGVWCGRRLRYWCPWCRLPWRREGWNGKDSQGTCEVNQGMNIKGVPVLQMRYDDGRSCSKHSDKYL